MPHKDVGLKRARCPACSAAVDLVRHGPSEDLFFVKHLHPAYGGGECNRSNTRLLDFERKDAALAA